MWAKNWEMISALCEGLTFMFPIITLTVWSALNIRRIFVKWTLYPGCLKIGLESGSIYEVMRVLLLVKNRATGNLRQFLCQLVYWLHNSKHRMFFKPWEVSFIKLRLCWAFLSLGILIRAIIQWGCFGRTVSTYRSLVSFIKLRLCWDLAEVMSLGILIRAIIQWGCFGRKVSTYRSLVFAILKQLFW